MRDRAVFLDRDGVINENRSHYVKTWEEFVFLPRSLEALRCLAQSDMRVIVVTNQSAINRGLVSRATVEGIHRRMVEQVAQCGGRIDAVFYCPHRPDEGCMCRKPQPGLLLQAAEEFSLNLGQSYLIGDAASDILVGRHLNMHTILVLTDRGREQLANLQARNLDSFLVADDLLVAVTHILGRIGPSSGESA